MCQAGQRIGVGLVVVTILDTPLAIDAKEHLLLLGMAASGGELLQGVGGHYRREAHPRVTAGTLERPVDGELDGSSDLPEEVAAGLVRSVAVALDGDVENPSIEGGEGGEEPSDSLLDLIESGDSLELRAEENFVDHFSIASKSAEGGSGRGGIDTNDHRRWVTKQSGFRHDLSSQ